MRKAIKNKMKTVRAYQLGEKSPVLEELMKRGILRELQRDGKTYYEVFTKETVNGTGEIAYPGDYIKLDKDSDPYPNDKAFFEKKHIHIKEDLYEQISNPMVIWQKGDPITSEIQYLIKHKGLILDEKHPDKYFTAPLWGSLLSAREDATLVIYDTVKDEAGNIIDVDFNFVERSAFETTYTVIEEKD